MNYLRYCDKNSFRWQHNRNQPQTRLRKFHYEEYNKPPHTETMIHIFQYQEATPPTTRIFLRSIKHILVFNEFSQFGNKHASLRHYVNCISQVRYCIFVLNFGQKRPFIGLIIFHKRKNIFFDNQQFFTFIMTQPSTIRDRIFFFQLSQFLVKLKKGEKDF